MAEETMTGIEAPEVNVGPRMRTRLRGSLLQSMPETVDLGFLRDVTFELRWPTASEQSPDPAPAPTAAALAEGPEAPGEAYRKLAAKLGVKSAALREAELESVLREEMIPVYEYAKVEAFLNDQCRRAGAVNTWIRFQWSWKPLRKQDRMKHGERVSNSVYQQAVPYPVLLRVEQIAERLPEAKFFVSEIEKVQDPFLAVTVEGSQRFWVIERWNEPNFRQ